MKININWAEVIGGLEGFTAKKYADANFNKPSDTKVTTKLGTLEFDTSKIVTQIGKPGYFVGVPIPNSKVIAYVWVECTKNEPGAKIAKGTLDFFKESVDYYLGMFSLDAIVTSCNSQAYKQWPLCDFTGIAFFLIEGGTRTLQAIMNFSYMEGRTLHKGLLPVAVYGEYDVLSPIGGVSEMTACVLDGKSNAIPDSIHFATKVHNKYEFNNGKI